MDFNADVRGLVGAFSSKQGLAETMAEGARQLGMFRGQEVAVVDATASLANAAEEMSFAASEKVEKRLSERKAGSKEALKASATDLADRYVNMMGQSQQAPKLHEFLESLKKLGANATESQIKQMAQDQFGDVSEQYAALAFAEEAMEGEAELGELRTRIGSVKSELLREAGPAIRAGLNIAGDVLAYSKQGLEQIDRLRDLYRYSVLGRDSASSMYQSIMQRYGESRFNQALEFLIRAAGSDLDAPGLGPSIEPAHLETAVNNINFVQQLGNLYRSLVELIDRLRPSAKIS